MGFRPKEVLFCPTIECNLACLHCTIVQSKARLSAKDAIRFLSGCKAAGIERVGFTGGEPFLALDFVCSVAGSAAAAGFLFGRIMTNGVWWSRPGQLRASLERLRDAGYDGDICVSCDALHGQNLNKVKRLIETAVSVWRRPDIVSLACVKGCGDEVTRRMLKSLAGLLRGRPAKSTAGSMYIRSDRAFIKVRAIDLSPVGKASGLKNPWDGGWFKEDYCRGPGNVFMVMPDGAVKPCCGYASESAALTIGNIKRDSAAEIVRNFRRNRFASTVFRSGLGAIRRRLEALSIRFPGKASSHCFFCDYILRNIPKGALKRCLDR